MGYTAPGYIPAVTTSVEGDELVIRIKPSDNELDRIRSYMTDIHNDEFEDEEHLYDSLPLSRRKLEHLGCPSDVARTAEQTLRDTLEQLGVTDSSSSSHMSYDEMAATISKEVVLKALAMHITEDIEGSVIEWLSEDINGYDTLSAVTQEHFESVSTTANGMSANYVSLVTKHAEDQLRDYFLNTAYGNIVVGKISEIIVDVVETASTNPAALLPLDHADAVLDIA